ncbi:MAG: PAS domain-containing protein [Deltaproteobacteria bacterium]|nr:PAS domain-containing protein [Deltaproteobacteria bacterium]
MHPFEGGISVFFQITTERKRAEEALRMEEQKLRSVIDNLTAGVVLLSPRMEVLLTNRRIDEWFPDAKRCGTTVCHRAYRDPPREEPCPDCPTVVAFGDGATHEATHEVKTARGERTLRIIAVPLKDAQGAVASVIETIEDTTDRDRLRAQARGAEKFKAVGQLAGGLAHEFNNKMSVVLGYSDSLLENLPPDNPLRADVEEIQKAGRRAAELTRQLLSFSQKQMLNVQSVGLNDVVMGMGGTIAKLIGRDVELSISLDSHLAEAVADERQIEEAVICLVQNANDAMPKGGRLSIKTENAEIGEAYCQMVPEARPGRYVTLSVQDTGKGMTREVLDHLFEPFFTTKGMAKGTGLALSAVHGMVKQSGGWISVSTEPGKGATFRIFLPEQPA